jgi:hypothetical protein
MKNKFLIFAVLFLLLTSFSIPSGFAAGTKEAAASLLLPTTGQAMNGQLGNTKTKIMAGVEVASITTVAVLGAVVGGPVIWAGLGPLIANHLWSSVDAYRNAQYKNQNVSIQPQLVEPQRNYQTNPQGIRERIMRAGQ